MIKNTLPQTYTLTDGSTYYWLSKDAAAFKIVFFMRYLDYVVEVALCKREISHNSGC